MGPIPQVIDQERVMKRLTTVAAMCVAGLLAAAVVAGEQPPPPNACLADVERLCKDMPPGGGRIARCLRDNEASVSAECKAHMAKMRENVLARVKAFSEACKGDLGQYCKDVQPGQGRITRCLRENEAKLSPSCREQLAKVDWRRGQMR
jgi:hypothetical protein